MTGAKRVTETGDLNSGNGEPIHIPVSIQPHGVLLAMAARTGCISQISANTGPLFGMEAAEILGRRLDQLFAGEDAQNLAHGLENPLLDENPRHLVTVTAPGSGEALSATAHRSNGVSIVEFEPSADPRVAPFPYYPVVSAVTSRLKKAGSVEAIAQVAVEEVRRIAGFDRILVYKFDEDWNGSILAEAAGESMPSFRHLRFVASDIPQHTRKLYEMNRLHFIADASYEAVPLVPPIDPVTNKPLDLSFATLRSAPPGHLGYLRDMGVASSICVSLLADDGRVWGLLACHHPAPRRVPIHVRTACDVLAQIVANQIEMAEQRETYEQRLRLTSLAARLLRFAAEEEYFIDGLTKHPDETLEFANAGGAAILHEGRMTLLGACPKVEDVWRLADWLIEQGREEIYHTDCLPHEIPDGERFCERASGLLAISISKLYRSYILWFRPEMVQTVSWAGNPQHAENQPSDTRANAQKSFETWRQTLHARSLPWTEAELQAAGELRNAVIGIVLRKAEELGELNAELQRSNRELEAFSYSVSHD
ncbi:MAG: GAF domain-containing protein, partial [Acidobacteriaceae bacterium]|nr:GAF domain-containing protein [Acidobacteriaceae bacterium]